MVCRKNHLSVICANCNLCLCINWRSTFSISLPSTISAQEDYVKRSKMSRFRFGRQHDGYFKVPSDDSGFTDAQFECPPPKIPWKAISLATYLFIVGSVLLVVGSLIVSGVIDTKYSDRLWPIIVLGGIMFLPGAYHVRIAYCAFREYPGYSFSDIPEFE